MTLAENLKQELIDVVCRMNALNINHGATGNASVRVDEGFLITPSGIPYEDLKPQDIVTMNLEGRQISDQTSLKPSSEWRFHLDIYNNRKDLSAIVHTHGRAVAALSCLREDMPPFHYMIALAGGSTIRCSEYATFATQELSENALIALEGRKACLLANHGQIACGGNLKQALSLAQEVECLSDMYLRLLQIDSPLYLLDEDEMERVRERFNKGYGVGALHQS